MSARISFRGAIAIGAREMGAALDHAGAEAMNDLANRVLEMLRLLRLSLPEDELQEIVRYSVRTAPSHYFHEPCTRRWFQLALHSVEYWDALRTCGDTRRLRLVGAAPEASR